MKEFMLPIMDIEKAAFITKNVQYFSSNVGGRCLKTEWPVLNIF